MISTPGLARKISAKKLSKGESWMAGEDLNGLKKVFSTPTPGVVCSNLDDSSVCWQSDGRWQPA